MNIIRKLAAAVLLLASVTLSFGAQRWWTGLGSSLDWSDVNNWSVDPITISPPLTPPGLNDQLYFMGVNNGINADGSTNAVGVVNNVMSVNFTNASLNYLALAGIQNQSPPFNIISNYYTTRIPPANVLSVSFTGLAAPVSVGDQYGGPYNQIVGAPFNSTTLTGGGTLVVSNSISSTLNLFSVSGKNSATLDMVGLSNLVEYGYQVLVAADSGNPNGTGTGGTMKLARTNNITTLPNAIAPGILLGSKTNSAGVLGTLSLGQVNNFNTDGLVVGGAGGTGVSPGCLLAFANALFPGSTFRLRASDGVSPISLFSVADAAGRAEGWTNNAGAPSGSVSGLATADFSGGTVDIQADKIYIGASTREGPGFTDGSASYIGTMTGTLIAEAGTITATNVYLSAKFGTNGIGLQGNTLTLRSNVAMTVVSNLFLGWRTNTVGTTNSSISSTLNVQGNAVLTVGGNITKSNVFVPILPTVGATIALASGGTINMLNNGTVEVESLTGSGYLTNASMITVTPQSSTNLLEVTPGGGNGFGQANVGSLYLGNNLTLASNVNLLFNLGANATPGGGVNDYVNVAGNLNLVGSNRLSYAVFGPMQSGTYHLIDYGGNLTGNPMCFTNTSPVRASSFTLHPGSPTGPDYIGFTITTAPANLRWSSKTNIQFGTNTVWSSAGSNNWFNLGTGLRDKFFQGDMVTFSDGNDLYITNFTPSPFSTNNPAVYVNSDTTPVGPSSANFNYGNSNVYANIRLAGQPDVNINLGASNTFFLAGPSGGNDIQTPIKVNTGILHINESGSPFALTGNGGVVVSNGAALDWRGYGGAAIGQSTIGPVTISGAGLLGNVGGLNITNAGAIYNGSTNFPPSFLSSFGIQILNLSNNATINTMGGAQGVATRALGQVNGQLNLNSYSLSVTGQNAFVLLGTVVNGGNIYIPPAGNLWVHSSTVDGGGTITLDDGATLGLFNYGPSSLTNSGGVGPSLVGGITKTIQVTTGNATVMTDLTDPAASTTATPYFIGGPVSLNSAAGVLNVNPGFQPISFTNQITGSGNVFVASQVGGVVNFTAANNYSGNTTNSGSTINLIGAGTLGSSNILISSGTLDVTAVTGGSYTIGNQLLQVDGSANGNLIAGSGGLIRGVGTFNGNVTVNGGGTFAEGEIFTGTNVVNGNLTFNGGTNIFTLGSAIDDSVVVNGNVSFNNPTVIRIIPNDFYGPSNLLYTYTGTLTGTNNISFALPRPGSVVVNTNIPGQVWISITAGQASLVWTGGTTGASGSWIRNPSVTNWLNGATPDAFFTGDNVTFTDTFLTNRINIPVTVQPSQMTMANSAQPYTFFGNGGITAGNIVLSSGGSVTFSNSGNTAVTGDGVQILSGNMIMNQPTNTLLIGKLSSAATGATLTKMGANTLSVSSMVATNFLGTFAVNGGTVQMLTNEVTGAGTTTVGPGARLDLNGMTALGTTIHASGSGTDGSGAIVSLGNPTLQQTNAVANLVFDDNTTLGASTSAWAVVSGGVTTGFQANGLKLTKTGTNTLWVKTGASTGLGDIEVQSGTLAFNASGTTIQASSTNQTIVRSNATLQLGGGTAVGGSGRSGLIEQGATILTSGGDNSYAGNLVLSNGFVQFRNGFSPAVGSLTLSGNLSGPASLTAVGTASGLGCYLSLSGSNSFNGVIVRSGAIAFTQSNSIPANSTNVIMNDNINVIDGLATLWLTNGSSSIITPPTATLYMATDGTNLNSSQGGRSLLRGNGTWSGPVIVQGNKTVGAGGGIAGVEAGPNGLTIAQTVNGLNFKGSQFSALGNTMPVVPPPFTPGATNGVTFAGAVNLTTNTTMKIGGQPDDGLGRFANIGGANPYFTKVTFNSAANTWSNLWVWRGLVQLGANNALPQTRPIIYGDSLDVATNALLQPVSPNDRRVVFDLNGFNQTLATNFGPMFFTNSPLYGYLYNTTNEDGTQPVWIGNGSSTSDSVLTLAGSVTNYYDGFIVDALDTNAVVQHITSLAVTSGAWLLGQPYVNVTSLDTAGTFLSGVPTWPINKPYTGNTTVSGGTLYVNRTLGTSAVTVTGGSLKGTNGVFLGPVAINPSGTLAPGLFANDEFNIGTLVVSNTLTLNGTVFLKRFHGQFGPQIIETNDMVGVSSTLTYGGNLFVTNLYNAPYTNGQVLKLFSAPTYIGSFSTITLPGVATFSDHLATDGAITVLTTNATVSSAPVKLVAGWSPAISPTSITLSWPSDHTGWRLQTQTNSLAIGLTNRSVWITVPGSTNTNSMTFPVVKTNAPTEYRIVYP
jgi:hypothetical protein